MPEFAPVVRLSHLHGSNGFRLDGAAAGDFSGLSVSSAGDVNGDGIDDLIIGAYNADPNGFSSGSSYVVFGKASSFGASIDLSALDGIDGFRLDGAAGFDASGFSVSLAGDVNRDGFDDVIVGAPNADPHGAGSGSSYVVFGKATGFAASIDLSTLDGTNGFQLDGTPAYDHSGVSVSSAGDINGDGFDDVIIGAYGDRSHSVTAGSSYVVFGKVTGFAASIDLSTLDGANGFRLDGAAPGDVGVAVSSAGDVNGDGFSDLIIGAPRHNDQSGSSYVVFGKALGFAAEVDLSTLDGTNGFRLDGAARFDFSGFSVSSAGDVNGDGFDDVIIGAYGARSHSVTAGSSYVVFGKASGFAAAIDLSALDGTNGFRLDGAAAGDHSGVSVSSAGDFNGDGFDDVIVGAFGVSSDSSVAFGASYVVFGKASGFTDAINLSSLDGNSGFRIDGVAAFDQSGTSVSSAGDINDDGFADVIVGAWNADPHGDLSGASYVIFGHRALSDVLRDGTHIANIINGGHGADMMHGHGGADTLIGWESNDSISGGSGNDTILGGSGADEIKGGSGNDRLDGGSDADLLRGGSGDDTFVVSSGDDIAKGGLGIDTLDFSILESVKVDLTLGVWATAGASLVFSTIEDIKGSILGADFLTGDGLDNQLNGQGGNDTLNGADGNDILIGALGKDSLTGGAGNDKFTYEALNESGVSAAKRDIVIDFTHLADKIDVSTIDADSATVGNQAFTYIKGGPFTGAGQIDAIQSGADTILEFNTDAGIKPEITILLSNVDAVTLSEVDFIL